MNSKLLVVLIVAVCLLSQINCENRIELPVASKDSPLNQNESSSVTTTVVKAPFQIVSWEKERLSFYLPCEINDNPIDSAVDTSLAPTKTREFVCDLNVVKYSVALTRSNNDISSEFEKLQQTTGAKLVKVNALSAVDETLTKSGKTTMQVEAHPDTTSYFSEVTKGRTFLIDKNRIVTLKAECKTTEMGYCEGLFNGTNEVTLRFFNTLEIAK